MGSRENLQTELEAVLGSRYVYFQPPETLKIKYPAIIYKFENVKIIKADDGSYLKNRKYTVTLIHNDPENTVWESIIDNFEYCSLSRTFEVDNLYHYAYDLYY